ncbi:hypothetical protein [Roseisolibacter agri]|uniref:Outer membrane protein beta-barrel domain-containing protein n=1 Tax=Roseisolibacter agri TaxID=2014610 RepID=A0AA37V2E5_9BACT|nr:hypothetical protein [Roseisolibacter agri]GLC25137.1 hypothetical protein rosag_16500 [Roseisolibacter agri]
MRTNIGTMLVACAIAAAPVTAAAQSESAIVAWIGLITTPLGAFTPYAPPTAAAPPGTSVGVQARYSHWQFDADDDNTMNVGAGLVIRRGPVRTAIELGRTSVKGCGDCDHLMAGVDVHVGLLDRPLGGPVAMSVAINPALGFSRPGSSDDEFTALAGALSVPVSLSVRAGNALRVVPFVSPGFGFARLSGGGESSTGSRAMLSGGLALAGTSTPVQLTASARRIFVEGTPTIVGVGIAVGR